MSILTVLPVRVDISVAQNTDNTFEFALMDGAGAVVDITSDTVKFRLMAQVGGAQKLAISNAAGSHTLPAQGTTRFTIPKATINLRAASTTQWWYEVRRVITGAGDEIAYFAGDFKIVPTV